MSVPRGVEPGAWIVAAVDVTDRANNYKGHTRDELLQLGFPSQIDVRALPSGPDGDGDGYSLPCDCDDTRAGIHPAAAEACDRIDNNCDGIVDNAPTGCALVLTEPMPGDALDCARNAAPPTISWHPGSFDRFRVSISEEPDFLARSTLGSGESLSHRTSWTVPKKKWQKLCARISPSLFIRVLGVDNDIPRSDPQRRVVSPTVTVNVNH